MWPALVARIRTRASTSDRTSISMSSGPETTSGGLCGREMQSASPRPRFQPALLPGRVWGRTRASITGAVAWSAVLILLLTLMIARSTATAAWVGGIDVVTVVALGGALLMGVLAVAPVPWAAGLAV